MIWDSGDFAARIMMLQNVLDQVLEEIVRQDLDDVASKSDDQNEVKQLSREEWRRQRSDTDVINVCNERKKVGRN